MKVSDRVLNRIKARVDYCLSKDEQHQRFINRFSNAFLSFSLRFDNCFSSVTTKSLAESPLRRSSGGSPLRRSSGGSPLRRSSKTYRVPRPSNL